jgi:RimJ/RimL family protein N-acetyltransferase
MSATPRTKEELLVQARDVCGRSEVRSPAQLARLLNVGFDVAAGLIAAIELEGAGRSQSVRQLHSRKGVPSSIGSTFRGLVDIEDRRPQLSTGVAITTERLKLRGWRHSDIEPFDTHCNTRAVMNHLGGVQSREALLEDIIYLMECERDGCTLWVAEKRVDGTFLGFCGLVDVIDENSPVEGELEIGWRIRQDEWRRGYAEEGANAALTYAFEVLKVEQVVARAAVANEASRALMSKLGLQHQPQLDHTPRETGRPLVIHIISREAWLAR